MKSIIKKRPGGSLLGLAFDSGRLESVNVRRTNGSAEIKQSLDVLLSLDPLTNAPELAGREIRKLLDEAGIKEKHCAVCLPLNWVMTLQVRLPDLPEEDIQSLLQIESERGFPYSIDTLMVGESRFTTSDGTQFATLVAVSRDHVSRLENVLKAAQLKPVAFSIGIAALQPPGDDSNGSVMALVPGESSIALQITTGGGVALLRTIDGAFEPAGSGKELQIEHIAREIRITLGQLPAAVRETLRSARVFGRNESAAELAGQLREQLQAQGIQTAHVREYPPDEFGVRLPSGTAVSPALSLTVRRLTGRGTGFEFLPPKISAWQQISARYASGKLVWAGGTAGAVAAVILLAFLVQQILIWHWESKWSAIKSRVTAVEDVQDQIKQYRPWYDESVRSLSILRRLTEAFPEEGTVSAKMIEIREPAVVTCSGSARDNAAFLKMRDRLSAMPGITEVHGETRGTSPVEFTFSFNWSNQGS